MISSKYKLILFDADGTLFDFHQGEREALRATFAHHGVAYDEDTYLSLYRKINLDIWTEFEQQRIAAEDLSRERFHRYLGVLNLDISPDAFSNDYLEALSGSTHTIESAPEVVAELAGHCRLVLITNGLSKVQHPRFQKSSMYSYFSSIVVSEDIGIAKPHPGIFEHAFRSVNHVDRSDVIIVGDNLSSDIQGGLTFGIDTCWFNPSKRSRSETIIPTYEIQDLRQLLPIVYARPA